MASPSEQEEEDWLELSLGFGSHSKTCKRSKTTTLHAFTNSPSSSSLPLLQKHQDLGFNGDHERRVLMKCHQTFLMPAANRSATARTSNSNSSLLVGLHNNTIMHQPLVPTHPGLWFVLHSSNREEGEGLPQIPRAYIRVRDENVTVFMVKKYLVTKLGLSNEAEIEISCKGQKLLHWQTLKHVRDAIWLPSLLESLNSGTNYTSTGNFPMSMGDHLMSLDYGRGRPSLLN